jgi:hypothetical protein
MSGTITRPAGRPDAILNLFHDAREIQRAVDTMAGLLLAALFATVRVDLGASGHRPAALCQCLAQHAALARCYFAHSAIRLGAKILCLLTLAAHAAPRV